MLRRLSLVAALTLFGCAALRSSPTRGIADELAKLSAPGVTRYGPVFDRVLDDALAVDSFVCAPMPGRVFFDPAPPGARVIDGAMPHYGVYFAPMHYLVRREAAGWRVEVRIVVDAPDPSATLELTDCSLADKLDGASECRPWLAPSLFGPDLCPRSPILTAPATRANVEALLARWSESVERYYDRDAARFGLPIHYDFEFALEGAGPPDARADAHLALRPGCGRTPYFLGLDSGWSLPILAHEVGHLLGLLDEFESTSEMLGLDATGPSSLDTSRMGESRREDSEVLPIHHYLVLRRYFCPTPSSRDPYSHAF